MDSKVCMNQQCTSSSSSSSIDLKRGWPLRSGGFATLCHHCGIAYEQLVFCDKFHSNDSGWRECTTCGKRLHCGCVASSSWLELLDSGGVNCISCSESHGICSNLTGEKNKDCRVFSADDGGGKQFTTVGSQSNVGITDKMKLVQFGDDAGSSDQSQLFLSQTDDRIESLGQRKMKENFLTSGEFGSPFLSVLNQTSVEAAQNAQLNEYKEYMPIKDTHGSSVQTNLTISPPATSGDKIFLPAVVAEERPLNKKSSSFLQGSRSRHLLPKPVKSIMAAGLEANVSSLTQLRVARPPVEGRIKNQLLPRYWPRITDQELRQISGDSNSTVVPLFEKVLSASDAGRIGRLVLPKACAEAYFPPISQPEGLPLRIQDVQGKEWVFQFRFWPNNNSRMYVLEGVTPCIQSMQLQAGDTVTFSRMDPEGKLLMGFRKASLMQDNKHLSSIPKGSFSSEPFFLPGADNLHSANSQSALLDSVKGSGVFPLSALSKHFSAVEFGWHIAEMNGEKTLDGIFPSSMLVPERKRSRNIGSKSKRLLIDSQDAFELKLSWEELQDMLCPPPCVKPSTVAIEDHEFEEYDQPPVFGKKSIFTMRQSGEQEQWAQCDSCLKWRRLPVNVLLPPKWTCQEHTWALSRPSCSGPEDLSPHELESLLKMSKEHKKQKIASGLKSAHEHESSDPDGLGNSKAVRGDTSGTSAASIATTTKHPRHRPGCSCIVCIQPPSGKGKHKPTCTCNVCMTVKRRFKTLMMRKKKRQSEREAEIAQRNKFDWVSKEEAEVESYQQLVIPHDSLENHKRLGSESEFLSQSNKQSEKLEEIGKEQLDLNCHPDRENLQQSSSRVSMVSLLQEASLPLQTYLKQNGLTSLVSDQRVSSGSNVLLPQVTRESEVQFDEDQCLSHEIQEQEVKEELSETDQAGNDPS
ncbi:B3 domain-containing transcription repressor VAL2-like isoform X2 [Coffea eugenioides]|uniref:B3 domain-containing transcription repressor VAL2-like isoform X2 n=1 Tax=Coffea eugenioides TaxID=49369 RepID=UPI000F6045F4|nr:B3 domain-containing transcription repressor VAL2-like isoform X2 [Coffea eugenioides]